MVGFGAVSEPLVAETLPQYLMIRSRRACGCLTALTTLAILAQLVLGAAFRHGAFGIDPHLVGAGVVLLMVVWTGAVAKRRFRGESRLAPQRYFAALIFRASDFARFRGVVRRASVGAGILAAHACPTSFSRWRMSLAAR